MDNIIHFQTLRKEKEDRLSTYVFQHATMIKSYVDRQVNIREKVKAKYIFSEKVGCERSSVFTKIEEQHFLDWFTFDYLTIKGTTNYQSFVDYSSNNRHSLDAVVHAFFMASVLEPFKVIKSNDSHIHAEKLLTGERCIIKTLSKSKMVNGEDIIFLRSVPVFAHLLCISEIFVQNDQKTIANLIGHFEKSTESWRTFLKKFSIKYSWNRDASVEK
ncbi:MULTISPECIES: hypothetical protein [Metabacillus]|jgi:hypothetical protein|uniref:Uncharacterized protein n=3 Tax=Metabacillus TaxID=2675233 RepID=A0A179T4S3_9BACI|nr:MULTISPECIES: hypothetical protein [Metabacillus]OAS88751.1 hypothetical protein A6K24_14955 [Metabacillus litoralis]QNF26528.1 hypothetical protein HUW50_02500 [Metabacillus sp. KUDC1714]